MPGEIIDVIYDLKCLELNGHPVQNKQAVPGVAAIHFMLHRPALFSTVEVKGEDCG